MVYFDRPKTAQADAVRVSSRTQLITQNSGLQALSSKESAKNQCVINSVQLLNYSTSQALTWKVEQTTETKA